MGKLVTACLAILGTILVQFLSKAFLDPLYELRKSIGEVRFNLAFHGATIHTRTPRLKEEDASDEAKREARLKIQEALDKAKEALMKSSSDLLSKSHAILFYRYLSWSFHLPALQDIDEAAARLRGLATYMYKLDYTQADYDAVENRVKAIEKLLRLKSLTGAS